MADRPSLNILADHVQGNRNFVVGLLLRENSPPSSESERSIQPRIEAFCLVNYFLLLFLRYLALCKAKKLKNENTICIDVMKLLLYLRF